MESHDHIQKQIKQAFKILRQLLTLINGDKQKLGAEEKISEVNKELKNLINCNIDEITNTPADQFISNITKESKLNFRNLDLLAELLYETGLIMLENHNKEQSKRLFNRSMGIYQYLLKAEEDFTYERHIKIKKLREILLQ